MLVENLSEIFIDNHSLWEQTSTGQESVIEGIVN